MHLVAIFTAQKQVWLHSVFDHVRRAPFAAHQRVETEVPPKIILKELWTTVHLPLAQDFERLAIKHEDAARPVAIGRAESTHVNAFRPAVDRVRTRIIGPREN